MKQNDQTSDRRDFLKTGAAPAPAAAATSLFPGGAHAAGNDEIKVGIIGCGGPGTGAGQGVPRAAQGGTQVGPGGARGTGAGQDVLRAAKGVTIVALGDAFEDRVKGSRNNLQDFVKDDKKA